MGHATAAAWSARRSPRSATATASLSRSGAARAGSLDIGSSSNVFAPHRGNAPGATVSVASDGGGASGDTRGRRDGACGYGGSIGVPFVSFGNGDSHHRSLGVTHAGSLGVRSSSNVFTPHRGGAPYKTVSVASDGGVASGATSGLRDGACDRGGLVGAPFTSFGDGDSQPISFGAARAGSLGIGSSSNVFAPHRGNAPGATVSVASDGGGASGDTRGRRDGACSYGGSISAPFVSFGNGDSHHRSLGVTHAGSLGVRSSSNVYTPHRGAAPCTTVSVASGGVAASSATRELSDGAGGRGGSVGAPLASFGDGDIQLRSLGATRVGSLDVPSSRNVFTSHRGGVPGAKVSVARDGGGASGATRGLRDGAGGHGGSVGAPLASFGDVDSKPRSLGTARAGSLEVRSSSNFVTPHRGGTPGATVSGASDGGGTSCATSGLRGCACSHGGSVGAPLAPFGDGDSHPRSLGATRAGSLDVHSSSNAFAPNRGGAPGATVSVANDGGGASGATRGLRDGACGYGGSVGAPPASCGDGDSQPRSLGAARAGSLGAHSMSNVFTPHRGGAPCATVPVASDGVVASSVTRGLRDGASCHGGSVGAPLASFGDGNSQLRSLGATRAGSLDVHSSSNVFTPHRGGVPGATVPGASDGGGACSATHGLSLAMVHATTAARSARLSPRSATATSNLAHSARRARARSTFTRRGTSSHRTAAACLAQKSRYE